MNARMSEPMQKRDDSGYSWGWRVDKIPVGGGVGLVFAVGVCAILLVGVPVTRWFFAGAVALGLVCAVVLHFTDRTR